MASASPEHFSLCFKRIRKMFPDEVTEACLLFLASHELNAAGRSMALWLTVDGRYMNLLVASDALPIDAATKALTVLGTIDVEYLIRFRKAAEEISAAQAILRALNFIPALGDCSLLIPWLRKLCRHTDAHVKSRAVKVLCELRPNKTLVERQMTSDDPRVRANAIEALWYSRTSEATELFTAAASDANHRVAGNALIGLYLQGDPTALARMIELTKSPDPLYRAAMAWSFGFIRDKSTVPLLLELEEDPSGTVRKCAHKSLVELQPVENAVQPAPSVTKPAERTLAEESSPTDGAASPSFPSFAMLR